MIEMLAGVSVFTRIVFSDISHCILAGTINSSGELGSLSGHLVHVSRGAETLVYIYIYIYV